RGEILRVRPPVAGAVYIAWAGVAARRVIPARRIVAAWTVEARTLLGKDDHRSGDHQRGGADGCFLPHGGTPDSSFASSRRQVESAGKLRLCNRSCPRPMKRRSALRQIRGGAAAAIRP